jgi:hypothetical protein
MRLRETETGDNGETITRMVSGTGIIIRLNPDVQGMKPSEVRRAFTRAAKAASVIVTVCETAHGHFDQQGKPIAEGLASAYQCIGTVDTLSALASHFAVERWEPALSGRIPYGAAGSGPEKVRPSAYKPANTARTHDEELVQRHRIAIAQLRERGNVG